MAEKATVRTKDAAQDAAETTKRAGERNTDAVVRRTAVGVAEEAGGRTADAARRIGETNVQALRTATDEGASALQGAAETAGQGYQRLAVSGRGNFGAFVEGWQEINRELASYMRAQFEQNVEAGRALVRCRTPQEALRVQGDYVRASLENFTGQASKLSRLTARVAGGGGVAPLQERASPSAEEKVSRQTRG